MDSFDSNDKRPKKQGLFSSSNNRARKKQPFGNSSNDNTKNHKYESIIVGSNNEDSSLGPAFVKARMTNEQRAKRFQKPHSARYEELRKGRDALKQKYIKELLMPDPNKQYSLDEAITLKGICEDYCPEFERYEREIQREVDPFEKNPETGEPIHSRMVKKFQRAAAGMQNPMPCDVRSPPTLERTLDYLISEIIGKVDNLVDCHAFVRDRTRSVRKDFTFQHNRGHEAVRVHERVARFHIIALHELGEKHLEQIHEERRQLAYTLTSLFEFYDDFHQSETTFSTEPEFRAYFFILNLFVKKTINTPHYDFESSSHYGQVVSMLSNFKTKFSLIWTDNPTYEELIRLSIEFFRDVSLIDRGFLCGCLIELHFPRIRQVILQRMFVKVSPSTTHFQLKQLVEIFAFDSIEAAQEFCDALRLRTGIEKNIPVVFIDRAGDGSPLFKVPKLSSFVISHKTKLIDSLRGELNFVDIIYGTYKVPAKTLSPKIISFKRRINQSDTSQSKVQFGSAEPEKPDSVVLPFKYPGLFKNSQINDSLSETSKPKDILYTSACSNNGDYSFSILKESQDILSQSSLPQIKFNTNTNPVPQNPVISFRKIEPPNKFTFQPPASNGLESKLNSFQMPAFSKPVVVSPKLESFSAIDCFPEPKPEPELKQELAPSPKLPEVKKIVTIFELFESTREDPILKTKAKDHYNTTLKKRFFYELYSKMIISRSIRKKRKEKTLEFLSKSLKPKTVTTPSYYLHSLGSKNLNSSDIQFEKVHNKIQKYKSELWSPLNFHALIKNCFKRISIPEVFRRHTLNIHWNIPVLVEDLNATPSMYLQKKNDMKFSFGSFSAKHSNLKANNFSINANIQMSQESNFSDSLTQNPKSSTFLTPIFQIVSLNENQQKFWETQKTRLGDFLSAHAFKVKPIVGIMYWPHSAQGIMSDEDIFDALDIQALEDQSLLHSVYISCMKPRGLESQVLSLFDKLLSEATLVFIDDSISYDVVVKKHRSEFIRLVEILTEQSQLDDNDSFYFSLQLGFQCLKKSFELLKVDFTIPDPEIISVETNLSNHDYISKLCHKINEVFQMSFEASSFETPGDCLKYMLLQISEASFDQMLSECSQSGSALIIEVCPEYTQAIDHAISYSQKMCAALSHQKRQRYSHSELISSPKRVCTSSDNDSSFKSYLNDVQSWLSKFKDN